MGMGNYACHKDVVKPEFVKNLCTKEYQDFIDVLAEIKCDITKFADDYTYSEIPGISKENAEKACEVFGKLCDAFEKATRVNGNDGLYLNLIFHEAQDRGDELNGVGWAVENVYQLTPSGVKFIEEIDRVTWTYFG